LLYESPKITGGLLPQQVDNLNIENITKLKIEFKSEQGELGNYDTNFGVVFINPILTMK